MHVKFLWRLFHVVRGVCKSISLYDRLYDRYSCMILSTRNCSFSLLGCVFVLLIRSWMEVSSLVSIAHLHALCSRAVCVTFLLPSKPHFALTDRGSPLGLPPWHFSFDRCGGASQNRKTHIGFRDNQARTDDFHHVKVTLYR